MKKNALSFFALLFYSFMAWGQPFAVEANLQLQAPLTPYLSDIVSGAPSKIQVQLLLRDDDELSYSARLHFTISGQGISIRTRQDISPPPIFLDYNVPVLLSGLDLFDYFQLEQLEFQGISPQDFLQQGGRLPEGVYNICVEVLDYNRFQGAAVSNQACTVVELSEWDPPLITSPVTGVPQQAAQNILFQWIPQHLGSFPVSYRFRLWEQREGLSVNQILEQTLPLYETQQLSSTSLLYGTDAPPLFAGQSYIVQVQAQDILGQQPFKNEGRSQHLIFTYGSETINTLANDDDPCTIRPQSLAPSALTIDGFMAHWKALPNVDHYAFSLAQDSAFLFPLFEYQDIPVIENQYRVQGLEEGIYYYRIRAIYENCESPFSSVIPVRLGQGCLPLSEESSTYSCGTATDLASFESGSLMEYLRVEDTIRAHDFKVVLQDVRGQGSFSGQGYVQVPYLQQAQVNVQFEGIKVDEYCRLVAGKMEVTGAGLAIISTDLAATIDSILGALEILEAGLAEVEDILEDAADFLAELEDIEDYLANGQSVLENLLHLEEHFPYLPQEATDAIQAAIDCLKNAQNADDFEACKAQMLAAIDQLKAAMESLYDADFRVNFGPVSPSQFGFDSIRHIAQAELYHKIPIAETDYWVPWQSLPSQQAGQVKAWAPSQSTFPEDIQFKDGLKQSIPIVDSQTASDKTLQLQGHGHEQSQTVYALQPYQDSLGKEQVHIAGQLNLISYTPKTIKVVLVPVNGTQYPHSIEALRQQLDHTFGQAIVDIDLSIHPNLLLPEFDNQMDSVPSGFLANYTDEMQLIRNRFKAANTIVEDTYYLFLVESSQDPSKLGYMPKKKPFGFIYHESQTTEAQYTKTIAHELAHGAFHLSHSFQDSPALPPGETDNLMDYAQGLHLQKYQWDLIHNPAANWTLFDGDEEGEMEGGGNYDYALEEFTNSRCSSIIESDYIAISDQNIKAFLTPSGIAAKVTNEMTHLRFHKGGLGYVTGFRIKQKVIIDGRQTIEYYDYVQCLTKETNTGGTTARTTFRGYINCSLFGDGSEQIKQSDNWLDARQIINNNGGFYPLSEPTIEQEIYGHGHMILSSGDPINSCDCHFRFDYTQYEGNQNWVGNTSILPLYIPYFNSTTYIDCPEDCQNIINQIPGDIGGQIYAFLKQYTQDHQLEELKALANFIGGLVEEKAFAFYGHELQHTGVQRNISLDVLRFLRDHQIFTTSQFTTYFPIYTDYARDCDIIFSTIELRKDIPSDYNKKTIDHLRQGQRYAYSHADLVKRQSLLLGNSTVLYTAIRNFENSKEAVPISLKDGTEQYIAIFGTNHAMFSWMQYFFNVAADVYDPVAAGQVIRKFSTFFSPGSLNDVQKFSKLKEATEVIKIKLETVRAGKISEAVDNIADEALQSIAQQVKSSQTAILDIELNQIDQKLYIYSPRPTGPGKGSFENIASLEKRDNTDFLVIEDNEFYPLDQFPNFSGTKVQADHIISSRGEYLEKVELVTKEDGTIIFRAAVDGIRNQLKAIGASDELIARIKSIDQAQVLTDDILSKRELLDFFEGRVNGVRAWEAIFPDEVLRREPDKLVKITSYQTNFGRSFDDISTEVNNLPTGERVFWINHLEFRTAGKKVNKAGNQHSSFATLNSDDVVPSRYTSDSRYRDLSFDPAHNSVTSGSRKEAMTGLEAECQQLIPGPISRDFTGGAEFIDGNRKYWDVKTAPGSFFDQQFTNLTTKIKSELELTPHSVLLDVSYINDTELSRLRNWLNENISPTNLEKIIEVNVNLLQ